MFGLFNKNKEEEKKVEKTYSPEYLELVGKWDVFLSKIEARFHESLEQAEEAVMDNLVESDYDMMKTMSAWSGIKSQITALRDKIENTFDDNVKPQMLDYVEEWDLIDQDQKGVQLSESFYPIIKRFEIELEGRVAQKFYDHAINFLDKDFLCSQCSGKLSVKKDIFRSHYVSCDYCNTVNTFTPNDKITEIRWVIDNIAKHKSIKEWDEKNIAQKKCKSFRSLEEGADKTDLELAYNEWEIKEKAYWKKYFAIRAGYVSEFKDTIEHDVNVKMKLFFYDDKERSDLYN